MAAGTRFRPLTLVLLLVAMVAGAFQAFREWRDLWAERHVVLSVAEVVRLHGDRAVVVLTDRSHGRRLPVPMTAQDGTAIDVDPAGGLCGTLVVERGVFGTRDVPLETSEALAVALDEGAPIETSLDLLEVAGISEEEARTLALDAARGRAREASSLPVHTF
jgi:hypothetical protein